MADRSPSTSIAVRVYDALLRCYPKAFREEYGRHMRNDFRSQWRFERAHGGVPLARFAVSVLADITMTAAREHLHVLNQDLRVAWRSLRKAPAFTVAAVATLALGIGATTAMFSIVYAVLLRPLPFREPARLVELVETQPRANIDAYAVSGPNFLSWRERAASYEAISALWEESFTFAEAGNPERVGGMRVSANLWSMLGVRTIAGRTFDTGEDQPGREQVALIGEGLWRRRYAADAGVVGRTVRLSGQPHTVIGIVPDDVGFTSGVDVWVPYAPDPRMPRGDRRLTVIGRLRPGVGVAQASAELDRIADALGREFPKSNEHYRARVRPLTEMIVSNDVDGALKVLLAAVGLLLLVACANVANLVLTRATAQTPELTLRRALGASAARLTRQVLTESLVLGAVGGVAGIALAFAALQVARVTLAGELPRASTFALDGSVLLFALAVTLITSVAFGLIPAWRVLRTDLADALRPAGRVVSDRSQARLRHAFVIGQFCLATMLAIGATLLAQSLARLLSVDVGFPPDRLMVASINPSPDKYPTPDHAGAFYGRVADEVRALPGVTSVGLASTAPFGSFWSSMEMGPTRPTAGLPESLRTDWRIVTSDYFRALDVPVRRGRLFADSDPETLRPIILGESVVRRLWPDGVDPIGQRVWLGNGQVRTVIGIVGDVHQRTLDAGRTPTMYLPTTWTWWPTMTLIVRTAGAPAPLAASLRDAVRRVDPDQAVFDVRTMSAQMQATAAQSQLNARLLGLFALLGLVLGGVGVAGVLADAVARRRAELALRMALGATGRRVVREVAARGLVLCVWGLGLGLIGALWLGRALSGLLFGVTAHDPIVFSAVAIVLMGVAAIACWLPASRVTRIDPATALRGD